MKAEKIHQVKLLGRNLNTNPYTISGLEGDKYDYHLLYQVNPTDQGGCYHRIYFNGDETANYRRFMMRGTSSTAYAPYYSNAVAGFEYILQVAETGKNHALIASITGKIGEERKISSISGDKGEAGAGVGTPQITIFDGYWKDTVNELTSIKFWDHASGRSADISITLYRTPKASNLDGWEKKKNYSWSNFDPLASPAVINGLSLDKDFDYKLKYKASSSNTANWYIRLNGDAGSNYPYQILRNHSGTLSAVSGNLGYLKMHQAGVNGTDDQGEILITGDSSGKRHISVNSREGSAGASQTRVRALWNNSVDDLTQVEFTTQHTETADLEVILYRRKKLSLAADILPFKKVKEVNTSGAIASGDPIAIFDGLLGDSAAMYKITLEGTQTGADSYMGLRLNDDSATSAYINQRLRAYSSTTTAWIDQNVLNYCRFALGPIGSSDLLTGTTLYIFPKSSNGKRLILTKALLDGSIEYSAAWWNNSVDELTKITFLSIGAGQTFDMKATLYELEN